MSTRKTMTRFGLAVIVAGIPALACASPVTYEYTGGSVTITATIGSSTVAEPTTIALTGNFATFDAAAGTLTNFDFTTTGSTTVALTGALAGESITVSNLVATPGAGYTSSTMGYGSGLYSFNASPVNAQGQYSLSGSLWNVASTGFNVNTTGLTGQLQTVGDQFALNGITIATKTTGGQSVSLKADIDFTGVQVVPVPPAIWLLASGLGLVGLPWLRRRRAV